MVVIIIIGITIVRGRNERKLPKILARPMRTEMKRNSSCKSAWPKVVMRKWLNIKHGKDEFSSDYSIRDKTENRKSCSDEDYYDFLQQQFSGDLLMRASDGIKHTRTEPEAPPTTGSLNPRMFVGTWNVGGKSPTEDLDLRDWLTSSDPADIYVLGFQEVVPLNAGNVLGAEDSSPAFKWLSLIRQALNCNMSKEKLQQQNNNAQQASSKPRLSFSDPLSSEDELGDGDFDRLLLHLNSNSQLNEGSQIGQKRYCLAASKQMVGIFLCVWVRADLYNHITNLKVSCVGRGIMGYLGNKGSISVSMTLHQTTFCFVCTHLTSGEKEGDEIRRNSDVAEILKRTRFSHSCADSGLSFPPQTILDHENIIWLGDLNYRLASGCVDTHELLKKNDWQALLENDQLRIEQRAGRVFEGWEEGKISFAPTYKYLNNSENYVYIIQSSKSKEKCRIPAWCDRILWKGEGLKQMWYVRGESRFSDHRPVYSLFSVKVNLAAKNKLRHTSSKSTRTGPSRSSASLLLQSKCVTKIQAEELLV